VALFLFLVPQARTLRAVVLLVGPTAASLGAWLAFGWTRQLFRFYVGYGPFADLYLSGLPHILSAVARELGRVAWGLAFLVPIGVLLLSWRHSRRLWLPVGTAAILSAFFLFTYLHDRWMLDLWISWSAARIFIPVAVLLAIAPVSGSHPGEA
jgi:hypothetical protein